VPLSLLTAPTEDLLEDMRHVGHEVDRIIPDDDGIIRFTELLGITPHIDFGSRQFDGSRHAVDWLDGFGSRRLGSPSGNPAKIRRGRLNATAAGLAAAVLSK
jgi:hypothetical protein